MKWIIEFMDDTVRAEMDALPVDMRARFLRVADLIAAHGLERVREPYVKHIDGPVWEIRMKGQSGIARALYVTATGRRVVVVRVFTQKRRGRLRAERSRSP